MDLATLKGVAEAAEEAAVRAAVGAGRVLARRAGGHRGPVASAATADVVDGTLGEALLAAGLALELLVEGEDGLLGDGLDVAGSSTPAAEAQGGLGQHAAEERGGTASSGARGGLAGSEGVAGSSTTRVRVGGHVGVWLGDRVGGRHGGGEVGVVVKWYFG